MLIERNESAGHAEHYGGPIVRFAGATVQCLIIPANVQSAALTALI